MNPAWQRFLGVAGAATLPAVLVLAVGWLAIRREKTLALHEARETANDLAIRSVERLRVAVFEPPLPSRADLSAWVRRPSSPDEEPCRRIARDHGGALALHTAGNAVYPPVSPIMDPAYVPRPLDPDTVAPAVWQAWEEAAAASRDTGRDPASRAAAWERALTVADGSLALGAIRLGAARSRFAAGQFREAAALFESVADARPAWASETGLSAVYLGLRGLLQIEELESPSGIRAPGVSAADRLCHLVLVRLRLPESLLDEVPTSVPKWRVVARDHAAILEAFVPLASRWSGAAPTSSAVEWCAEEGRAPRLLTSHRGADGTWWLLRSADALAARADACLAELGLPRHLGAEVTIAGQRLRTNTSAFSLVASVASAGAHRGMIQLDLHLARPELLERDIFRRTRRLVLVVGFAAVFAGLASLATVQALARQRRLAELQTDFVASVTHELRAPLAAIRLIADELVDLPETETARRTGYSRLILREVRRLGFLIENVLLHARLERGAAKLAREPVDLLELLDETREGLLPIAREREIEVRLELPSVPVSIPGDAGALRQVLVNLIDNALKHAPPRSAVDLILAVEPASGTTPAVRVTVADQGPGVPIEDQERIFDRFYRRGSELRRETTGVGLGLAIARRLVHAHGGTLEVRSEPGQGARFTVRLPGV